MKTRLALLLPLLALAACVDNNASVRLAQICAMPDDPKTCSFSSTCDAETIGPNTLDISRTNFVWMAVQADNQRPDTKNLDVSRLNTATAWGQEIEVEYMGANVPSVVVPIQGSAEIPAAGSSVLGLKTIPETTGNLLITTYAAMPIGWYIDIFAKVKLRGKYGDETSFETGELVVPFRICNGCLAVLTPPCPTATDVVFSCPGNPGQEPISQKCSAP